MTATRGEFVQIASSWWATLKRDRWAQLGVVIYAVTSVLYWLPALSVEQQRLISYYAMVVLLLYAILPLRLDSRQIKSPSERRFWNDLTLAYVAWLVAEFLYNLFDSGSLVAGLTVDLSYGVYYISCVFALERKAHQGNSVNLASENSLRWPAIVAFVIGLHAYFVVIPALMNPKLYQAGIPIVFLYLILDIYISVRFLFLSRTAGTLRWKALYSLLAVSFIASTANGLSQLMALQEVGWLGSPALWNIMIVVFVLAVRLRHHPFPTPGETPNLDREHIAVAEPRWQTLFFALVFPLIHFVLYGIGTLDMASRTAREVAIAAWLILIGGVALFQYRMLERSKKRIEKDRDSLSDELLWRKKAQKERERLVRELEDKNAELERFTYTVSHDLKTPLVTIIGFLGFVKKDLAAGNAQSASDDLQRIDAAAKKMARLLEELLELSRVGHKLNKSQSVSLRELASEAVDLAHGPISARGVTVEVADDLPEVKADRSRLLEVFQNLIENAVKFMGDQPDPRIEVAFRHDSGIPVYFVRDNGIGLDPQYQETIFGLFNRLDVDVDGTGVGLALVKRIVEVHGGRVWVESEGQGHGSTFCFTLSQPAAVDGNRIDITRV